MARLAKSLETLRAQIDALAPGRDKESDGTFPSAEHLKQNPNSDHNTGHALDITNDPGHGVVATDLAEQLRQSRDRRIKYIISNRRISNPTVQDWAWRPHNGINPHDKHFHTSVVDDEAIADDTSPWKIELSEPTGEVSISRPRIGKGAKGPAVSEAQQMLGVVPDGVIGPATVAAIMAFQAAHGLEPDGIIGPYTWDALLGAPTAMAAPPSSGRQTGITATVFSSTESGKKGAYGEWLDPDTLFVSLPAAFPAPQPFIRIFGPKGSVVAQIKDKGPWYDGTATRPADEYWLTGARPRAESDPNTNKAGIDVSQGVADRVGVPGKGPVDWEFVTAAPAPTPYPTPIPEPPTEVGGGFPFPFPLPFPFPGQPAPPQPGPNSPTFNLPVGDLFSVIGRASRIMALFQAIPKTGMTIDRYLAGVEDGLSTIVHGPAKIINQTATTTAPLPLPIVVPTFPPTKANGVGPMNTAQILSILRVLLAAGGPLAAWVTSKGFDPSMILTIVQWLLAVGVPAVVGVWGGNTHSSTNQIKAAAAIPGVTVGVDPSEAPTAVVDVAKDRSQPKVLVTTPAQGR